MNVTKKFTPSALPNVEYNTPKEEWRQCLLLQKEPFYFHYY